MKLTRNYGLWLVLLSTSVILCSCGIKPGHLSPPSGEDPDEFPRNYPMPPGGEMPE